MYRYDSGQPWFGGNSGVAIDNAMQEGELRYQLRRLSHHACIFIWDACNGEHLRAIRT